MLLGFTHASTEKLPAIVSLVGIDTQPELPSNAAAVSLSLLSAPEAPEVTPLDVYVPLRPCPDESVAVQQALSSSL
jgi:hypothetical protein